MMMARKELIWSLVLIKGSFPIINLNPCNWYTSTTFGSDNKSLTSEQGSFDHGGGLGNIKLTEDMEGRMRKRAKTLT
jgi:hypothetical protein